MFFQKKFFRSFPLLLNISRTFAVKNVKIAEVEESVNHQHQANTIFDQILLKEVDCEILLENNLCMAFKDTNPQSPVHLIVIPKKKIMNLNHIQSSDKNLLGEMLFQAQELGKKLMPEGYRIVINNGLHGGQTINYLHVHVLGGRQMLWPPG